jgi:hypothetical protein
VRSSRHIFQQTQRRRIPQQKPKYLQQLRRDACQYDSKNGRNNNADYDGALSLLRRQAGSCKANDDCVVSSQHQVDHDDLQQCRESFAVDAFTHDGSFAGRSHFLAVLPQPEPSPFVVPSDRGAHDLGCVWGRGNPTQCV